MSFLLFFLAFLFPFNYDLHLTTLPGKSGRTMVCFHGMGGNWQIAKSVKDSAPIDLTIISFNFPDHDANHNTDVKKTTFGTKAEVLPAIAVLKKVIIDEKRDAIDLYGFSAGGGALVNVLALLNSEEDLNDVGVSKRDKKRMLDAIQKGWVLLDTPLKSCEEILAFRNDPGLDLITSRYASNNMVPLKNIAKLKNLALHVIIHFQNPDKVLSNRDDALYIAEFQKYNVKGSTYPCIGYDSGHSLPHPTLWACYKNALSAKGGHAMAKEYEISPAPSLSFFASLWPNPS